MPPRGQIPSIKKPRLMPGFRFSNCPVFSVTESLHRLGHDGRIVRLVDGNGQRPTYVALEPELIGSFLGAWLGGYLFDKTGSYSTVWMIAIALGLMAAVVNLPIREQALVRPQPVGA